MRWVESLLDPPSDAPSRTGRQDAIVPTALRQRRALTTLFGGVALALIGAGRLCGQGSAPPIPEIDDFRLDGAVSEWRARPIDRILPAVGRIPQALLWIGQVPEGLVVAAEIRSGIEHDANATLRIGLSGDRAVEFPPFGWGHQFGFEVMADSTGCGDLEFGSDDPRECEAWVSRQRRYREALPPLFEREWRVAPARPEAIEEVTAGPAFARLPAAVRSQIGPLAPRGTLNARARPLAGTDGGTGLEVLIPWSALPPVRVPTLSAVRIDVAWVDPAVPSGWDESWLGSLAPRALSRPLEHTLTPCHYGFRGVLISGGEDRLPRPASEEAVVYMIPEGSGDLRSLIVLDNEAAGYQYDPDPETISPAAFQPTYEVLDVGRGERLCTPMLAFSREGESAGKPDWTRTREGDWLGLEVEARALEVRRLDDGDLLVKSGVRVRRSYYGSGQCGGCPRISLDIFGVSTTTGEITPALRLHEVAIPGTLDIEVEIAEDWRTVSVFRSRTDLDVDPTVTTWKRTAYCLVEGAPGPPPTYEVCGEEDHVPEPPNRLRRRYLESP